MNSLHAAGELVRAGISVVPIRPREKRPIPSGWQDLRLTEPDLPRHFTNGQNVGALLGEPSGGHIDTDLDAPEARQLAPLFLPSTGMKHGRASAPASHWWYKVEGTVPRRLVYSDPTEPDVDRGMLVEVRGTGHQTIVPPSIHPSGQVVEWDGGTMGEAATIDTAALTRNTGHLAACALLARHWPGRGMRDELAKDLSGALAHTGWPAHDIDTFIVNAARVAGDEEARMRAKGGHAVRKLEHGGKVTGWPSVAKVLDPRVVDKLREWLGIRSIAPSVATGGPDTAYPSIGGALPPFNLTDSGNAELFAHLYGDHVRYDRSRRLWLTWQGHWWTEDRGGKVERLSLEAARRRYHAASEIGDLKLREATAKWAITSESRAKREATLALATAEHPIADTGEGWDADPFLLGVANGVVQLLTGELQPGRHEDRITIHTDVTYDPDALAPRWEQFLDEVFSGDAEIIGFIQRAAGYSLTGDTSEQCLFVPYGGGSNGKSTLLEAFRYGAGGHAYDIPFSALEYNPRQTGASNDVASLAGKRLVTAVETNEGVRLNEARVKALTGGDPMTARFLYQEHFTFRPLAKFWLGVNHRPRVNDDSYGFWRRVHLIPFTRQFTGEQADKHLEAKLKAEAPGILAWMVRGCREWQRAGLQPPVAVRAATEQYREENDPLADFIADRCFAGPSCNSYAADLYRAYRAWAETQGIRDREQLTNTSFGRRMSERFEKGRDRKGVRYSGIALLAEGGEG